jgi:hypothetical protein
LVTTWTLEVALGALLVVEEAVAVDAAEVIVPVVLVVVAVFRTVNQLAARGAERPVNEMKLATLKPTRAVLLAGGLMEARDGGREKVFGCAKRRTT